MSGPVTGPHGGAQPWIFAQWTNAAQVDKLSITPRPGACSTWWTITIPAPFNLKLFKKFAPYFCANFKFSLFLLKQINQAKTMDEMKQLIDNLFVPCPKTLSVPNLKPVCVNRRGYYSPRMLNPSSSSK